MNNVQERLAKCFANVFPDVPQDEIPRASTASLAGWDSVAHVTLLSSIEEEFGFEFAMEDYDELVSYALVADYLENR